MNSELLQIYNEISNNIQITKRHTFSEHVNPSISAISPIHNWYRFKEGYSPLLLNKIIKYTKQFNIKILDPFCGSGTTLLSALMNTNVRVDSGTGVEVNPFIHFVANTKINFFKLDINRAEKFLKYLTSSTLSNNIKDFVIPDLTTISKAYSSVTLAQILSIKDIIKNYFDKKDYEYNFFLLTLSAILEDISCMRKSGRALKVVKEIKDYDVKEVFLNKARQMINDVKTNINIKYIPEINIINQDVRELSLHEKDKFNLAVFSPPYLNHFDYTEVYKVELWMLDFILDYDEFRNLRFKTLRSHPSVKFEQTHLYTEFNSEYIKRFISILEESVKQEVFYDTIKGYIDDMYKTFIHLRRVCSNDAFVSCIVANSLFGSRKNNNFMPVATDLIISEIARDLGFDIIEILEARKVTRRGLAFAHGRESIIMMKNKVTDMKYSSELTDQIIL